jgi:hypothetical protein
MGAVVKGTRFAVGVSGGGTDLSVRQGLVGVTDLASGQSADIAPGQRAATSKTGLRLSGQGEKPAITTSQPRQPLVKLVSLQKVKDDVKAATSKSSPHGPSPSKEGDASAQAKPGHGKDGKGGSKDGKGGSGKGGGKDGGGSKGGGTKGDGGPGSGKDGGGKGSH